MLIYIYTASDLSKNYWKLADNGAVPAIKFPFMNNCDLYLSEKAFIIRNLDDVNMLGKRSEFISKCRHINKRLLNKVKDDSNDWLWCMFAFTVCCFIFWYFLWNLFVFVGKNIDCRRLSSMKPVVSIMLYWIPSQSSLSLSLSLSSTIYAYIYIYIINNLCYYLAIS